jgi:hypothetical protein
VDKLPVELSAVVAKRWVALPILAGWVGEVSVCVGRAALVQASSLGLLDTALLQPGYWQPLL